HNQPRPSTGSVDSTHLSPVLSRVNSESVSPSINNIDTPSGSNYHASDFSDLEDDPFFGADFGNAEGGTPSFLDDHIVDFDPSTFPTDTLVSETAPSYHDAESAYPLTPEQTASVQNTSPRSELKSDINLSPPSQLPTSVSPRDLQKPFNIQPIVTQNKPELTPSQSSSCRSSEDGLAPAAANMVAQSPRVTVSFWGKDVETSIHPPIDRALEDSPTTVRGGFQSAGDLITSTGEAPSAHRDAMGIWKPDPLTGQTGLGPDNRPSNEVTSINELASNREIDERNETVGRWLSDKMTDLTIGPGDHPTDLIDQNEKKREDTDKDKISLGHETSNQYKPGQTYFTGNDGALNHEDYNIILSNRNWDNGPMLHSIRSVGDNEARYQPQSSQAAIERFEQMCRDTDSIVSRAATWGTRRRSLPSVIDLEIETSNSGNLLKKFSISRGERGNRPGNLLKDLRGLMRRPSAAALLKRNRDSNEEESVPGSDSRGSQDSKRDSISLLNPPGRMPSFGKKPTPSLNTALVSMGQGLGSIGTAHSRSGSISATPVTSPKSPFSLSVKGSLRRPRSKSELPKGAVPNLQTDSHPSLVGLWRQSGGPPVMNLVKPTSNAEAEDDDDEDDELGDDSEMKGSSNLIDHVTADMAGFQQHVLTLNPSLATANNFLVERIAHQQVQRYKQLLRNKVTHMGLGSNCPSGALCVAMGGSANILDQGNDARELDPLSSLPGDDDGTPTEGKITHESFPQDIPVPPTVRLPAEFECQLCYQSKKFQKPSDWTKHVHEDVQPFTCTWDKCREPKIFKRKADWVRHENEGHRHLEWWVCDVEGCHHRCYRRDNFLQHLVREHKYPEPKVKTKAAIKKAGGADPTWQKVELCHMETQIRPQDEPCRFCGRQFPTWKKLTVHLAKHMEQISLPVLRLVDAKAKEISADTVISPVQDLPPRPMLPTPTQNVTMVFPTNPQQQVSPNHPQGPFQSPAQVYPVMPPEHQFQTHQQPNFYHGQYGNISHNLQEPSFGPHAMNQGYGQQNGIPVTTAAFVQPPNQYHLAMQNAGIEFSPMNPLGLQNQTLPMGQMGYDGIMDPSSGNGSPFSGHGSISPYTHSPNPNA
ncbi:hypothetical protein BGZ63DRAFT_328873, partial [Mariannaea sp. PMI_226]